MTHTEHIRRELCLLAATTAEIRLKALEMGQREVAKRLLVASRLIRATLHAIRDPAESAKGG